jgi:hypothetical protein
MAAWWPAPRADLVRHRRGASLSHFRLSKSVWIGKARRRPGRTWKTGATHAYLGARQCAAQGVESGKPETAHSKVEPAFAELRRKQERVKASRSGRRELELA